MKVIIKLSLTFKRFFKFLVKEKGEVSKVNTLIENECE